MNKSIKNLLTDWEWLTIRVLVLGLTVFLWSYITEVEGVTEAFGDTTYKWIGDSMKTSWGFRHWVYTVTFSLVTVIQVVKIFKWIEMRSDDKGFKIKGQ